MNDDRSGGVTPDSEAETVQPNKTQGAWEMPAPKFQQTSGYLPQGYLERVGMEGGAAAAPAAAPAEVPALDVEPQPDVSDQLDIGPTAAVPAEGAVRERSTGVRVALMVLGLLGMVAFIVIFLVVVYYLFINPQNGGSTF